MNSYPNLKKGHRDRDVYSPHFLQEAKNSTQLEYSLGVLHDSSEHTAHDAVLYIVGTLSLSISSTSPSLALIAPASGVSSPGCCRLELLDLEFLFVSQDPPDLLCKDFLY